ncbi:MAG: peptidoglycan recognition protein family protein [Planctomycetota bacterium]|jgi:hypothetical protein
MMDGAVDLVAMEKEVRLRLFVVVCFFGACLFVLSGCTLDDEPVPEIVYDRSINKVVMPLPRTPPKVLKDINGSVPGEWLPSSRVEKKWKAIVIHHSGTESGNAAIFNRWHQEDNEWDGVGYDFVIGNGTDSGDGRVEVTFRWRQQRTGAHCKTPGNWANEKAIGICLVGNFDRGVPTVRQMQSLVQLVRFLQSRYRIPRNLVYGHKNTPGARVTECPGGNFPMARLKSMLDF